MNDERQRLLWAVAAFQVLRTPTRITAELGDPRSAADLLAELSDTDRERVQVTTDKLIDAGAGVLFLSDDSYPDRLRSIASPPALLFFVGELSLLDSPAVGMCGSRDASDVGLAAARLCGEQVARHGLTVVSGYARGVDMATHIGALEAAGSTIIVLAEGVLHFRWKRELQAMRADQSRVLVLSQFPPGQTWNVGAAMTRNVVISALGRALVVVEARETGGTFDAALQALRLGRPVFALDFSVGAPRGNALLFEKGARRIASTGDLHRELDAVKEPTLAAEQMSLAMPAH